MSNRDWKAVAKAHKGPEVNVAESFTLRPLIPADVPIALQLSRQNGWNQLEADWLRFLHMQPDGCFAAEVNGAVVGTACGCIFDSVAWVALVLVDQSHRNRGLGTALMRHVLTFLGSHKVQTIRLDATPLGRPIYEKLGFVAEYELARFAGVPAPVLGDSSVEPGRLEDLEGIIELDTRITQTDRRKFLERLFAEAPGALRIVRGENGMVGYAGSRPGAIAAQVGPCLADGDAGPLLLADAFHRLRHHNIFIDIPLSHARGIALAKEKGLTVQRHLLRMYFGRRVFEGLDFLWASAGPEKG